MDLIFKASEEELQGRIGRFQDKMTAAGIDAAVIVGNTNLFYFSGSCQSGHLIIPARGEAVYLVRKTLERARQESSLGWVSAEESIKKVASTLIEIAGEKATVGLELDILPVRNYQRYQKYFAGAGLVDISNAVKEVRAVKSDYEVEILRCAADINRKMFDAVSRFLIPGQQEVVLAGRLEAVLRSQGHQGLVRLRGFNQEVFYGHLMSGENSVYPSHFDGPTGGAGLSPAFPQSCGWKEIRRNEPILVDYTAVYQGYVVDKTRIFCLGKLPPEMMRAHEAALAIQEEVIKKARPGVPCGQLYDLALEAAGRLGFADHFMGFGEKAPFVGHGVGLELDEFPVLASKFTAPLEPGMVFALEPKMFFPEKGVVGVENTLLVTEDGVEVLTSYPEDIIYL